MSNQRRVVRMFQNRFADDVAAGIKRQTIRPTPKVLPREGDLFDGRAWQGRPYRSKQRKLVEGPIEFVLPVHIASDRIELLGVYVIVGPKALDRFAAADGFASWRDLVAWFEREHGLPFDGIIIGWDPDLR